jgi:predicted amidohydrolase
MQYIKRKTLFTRAEPNGKNKELNINIIPGSYPSLAVNSTPTFSKFHNTTCYISRTGRILSTYHKVNLWGSERLSCVPGTSHTAFNTPEFGPIGLLICWDLAFPEALRTLMQQDARYIFIPTMWKSQDCGEKGLKHGKDSERTFIDSVITARAFEENCVLVFCNVGGDCDGGKKGVKEVEEEGYFSASQVTMPFKGQISRFDGREQCLVVEVDNVDNVLKDAEEVWNIRRDVQRKDWYLGS